MNSLKFNNVYLKFPSGLYSGDEVRLMEVFKVKLEDLHESFVYYDTITNNFKVYDLPDTGDVLVLLLMFGTEMFTTIREYTQEKEEYYRSLRGNGLVVEIK